METGENGEDQGAARSLQQWAPMVMNWIGAAAAAGSLSTTVPAEARPSFAAQHAETRAYAGPGSERARIVEIATEVRRLVARFADTDQRTVVAPRTLQELGIDEAGLADVVLGLEERFDIDIDADETGRLATVGDVVALVARRVREVQAA